jgi:molybdopterin molybdotransferase
LLIFLILRCAYRYIFADITNNDTRVISVEEALKAIADHVTVGSMSSLPVTDALGHVLASDVLSPIDMPPFRQSAMDGFAICSNGGHTFALLGEVKAGDGHEPVLKAGEAIRIFTGAPVPSTADTVIRQEDTRTENAVLTVASLPAKGANIRPQAEQIGKGEIALKQGHVINEASIGYLATLGITHIPVYQKPKVAILITGNELVKPGQKLQFGQIYESNAPMLVAALHKMGVDQVAIHRVRDDFENTTNQLQEILNTSDLVICSGGISVGDYDFVGKALQQLGVSQVFYKVRQKPGKPLFFGRLNEKLVFALPGNPAAALTCFYVYVAKAIDAHMGNEKGYVTKSTRRIAHDYIRKGDRAHFLKAKLQGDEVSILEGQSSAMLHTFALANALVYVPVATEGYQKGDEVTCILLP